MSFSSKNFFDRTLPVIGVLFILLAGFLEGCGCEPELPPPPPPPEISVVPNNWIFGTENLLPGLPTYKTILIKNVAKSGADELEVKDIKLIGGGSPQFKLIDGDCPKGAPKEERKGEEGLSQYCVEFPSLPQKIPAGSSLKFAIMYTHTTQTSAANASLEIVSNAKNKLGTDTTKTKFELSAQAGQSRIDVGGPIPGKGDKEKEFVLPMGKVKKGSASEAKEFVLTNVGKATLEFKLSWEKQLPSFILKDDKGKEVLGKKITIEPNDNRTFKVTFDPKACGSQEAFIKISSNARYKKPDPNTGYSVSASELKIRVVGSSPSKAEVSPQILEFDKGATKTFSIKLSQESFCDLEITKISIGKLEGQEDPKYYKVGKVRKGGTVVPLPVTVSYTKKEELTVEIIYAPPNNEISDTGVVNIESNDETLSQAPVTLQSKGKFNLPPRPSFFFNCGEENSKACKKGEQIAGALQLSGERKVKVILDSSKSIDKDGKIAKYEWSIKGPTGSGVKISDTTIPNPFFIVDGRGKFTVTLNLTDDKGKKNSQPAIQTLNVVD